jgi:uncharacterized protein YbaR (Trm112 family)
MFPADEWLTNNLVCPRDHTPLYKSGHEIKCLNAHLYPVVDGVPIMLLDDVDQTCWWATTSIHKAQSLSAEGWNEDAGVRPGIDPFVQEHVAGTCGLLYRPLIGKLFRYPILVNVWYYRHFFLS